MKGKFCLIALSACIFLSCATDFIKVSHVTGIIKNNKTAIVYYSDGKRHLETEKKIAENLTQKGYTIITGLDSVERLKKPNSTYYELSKYIDLNSRPALDSAKEKGAEKILFIYEA